MQHETGKCRPCCYQVCCLKRSIAPEAEFEQANRPQSMDGRQVSELPDPAEDKASTPGKALPSIHSRNAPPAVDT
jgi:hypothetical protein